MRVALAAGDSLFERVRHVLLADERIDLVGVRRAPRGDRRVVALDDVAKFDLLIADDPDGPDARRAAECQLPVVVPGNLPPATKHPLVIDGANLRGLARCLGATLGSPADGEKVAVAVTAPGRKLSKGTRVAFPYPVGSLLARQADDLTIAPHEGGFAAISIAVTGPFGTVTHGLVDDAAFAAAACLAAAVFSHDSPASHSTIELQQQYVSEVMKAGVSVARLAA